ncbi:MAG: type 4a pilus biogenesis protein PilO [Candidatus Omnitrophota bacterium]
MPRAKASRVTLILIFSISGIVVIAALYLFAGRPVFKYADRMRAQFASNQDKLQQAEALMRSLPNPQKSLEDIRRKYSDFRETSGTGKQLPKIIQALGQSAVGRQINVISIRPQEDMKAGTENLPPGVKKLFFEMIFSASYRETGEYVMVLNDLPGVFTIETMTIHRQDNDALKPGEQGGSLNVNLIISTVMAEDL